jgi:hypothetical protein
LLVATFAKVVVFMVVVAGERPHAEKHASYMTSRSVAPVTAVGHTRMKAGSGQAAETARESPTCISQSWEPFQIFDVPARSSAG